jgi:uncharacterized membrane protein
MDSSTSRFEDYPLTRQEYISAMVHFYRGEIGRSIAWRQRLDATTNWAVLTAAGMLSFSFATPENPHIVLLLSNFILLAYLMIEARRYRYFEVYRARVRMLEENFLIPIVTRQLESPMMSWREMVAMDLDVPKYKTTLVEAMGFRLRRNYIWIMLIILGGWLVKLYVHPTICESVEDFLAHVAVGSVPAGAVLMGGLLFYGSMIGLIWWGRHLHGGEPDDEIAGLERNLEQWKL